MPDDTAQLRNLDPKLSRLFDKIRAGNSKVERKKLERKNITAEINEVRTGLEAEGIHKDAFDLTLKYLSWDSNKRRGFDRAYALAREALGVEIEEDDLFAYRSGDLPQKPATAEKKAKTKKLPQTPGTSAAVAEKAMSQRSKPKATTKEASAASDAAVKESLSQIEDAEGAKVLDMGLRKTTH